MEQDMYTPKTRFEVDLHEIHLRLDRMEVARYESLRRELMLAAIKAGRWKECKSSLFPAKPTERYLLVLGNYGQLGLTPQELYSIRKIWLQAPDETFDLSVKTIWANLHKLAKSGLAESRIEGLTYRYFAKQEKYLDLCFRQLLGSNRSKPKLL
jgi:hypothetical protein